MARIFILTCVIPGNTGGIENFVYNEAAVLRAQGKAVSLFISNRKHGGVFRRCVRLLRYLYRYKVTSRDVIHLHDPRFLELSWITLLFWRSRSIYVSTHGLFFHTKKHLLLKKFYLRVIAVLISGARGIICSSEADHNILSIFKSLPLIRFDNPVDIKLIGSREAMCGTIYPKKFIYWGRLSGNKNIDLLLRVFEHLNSCSSDYTLTIVSRDSHKIPEHNWLSLETANTDIELRELVKSHEAFISLSSYEGFGLALYEAFSSGLVVYCFEQLPVVQYINKNIVVFENLHQKDIKEKIISTKIEVEEITVSELRTWQNVGDEFLKMLIHD